MPCTKTSAISSRETSVVTIARGRRRIECSSIRDRASTHFDGEVSRPIGSSIRSVSMSESARIPGVDVLANTRRRRGSSRDHIHHGTSIHSPDESCRTARSGIGRP